MPPIIFGVDSSVSRAPQLSNSQLINCFVERQPETAKSQTPLFGAPGITALAVAGNGPCRGSWNFNGVAYFVQGTALYRIDSDGTSTQVGTGILGNQQCDLSDNGVQLCIVNGAQGYIYTIADGLVQITSPAFYPANTVAFMDGYFIFDRKGTNEYFLSGLFDGLSYNALDFASAEAQPGFVVAAEQNLQLLFIFCTGHIELWYDAGTSPFPFQRYAGGIINYGCISPGTIIKQDGAIFFLGTDHIFYRLQANVPIRVSTHPIEHIIEQVPNISLAICQTYSIEGHKMVAITFPDLGRTLEYDISTQKWHDRQSWQTAADGSVSDLGIWRASSALAVYDSTLVGDAFNGQIGYVDWTNYTEYGGVMPMIARSITVHNDRQRIFVPRFELDVEAGVGLTSGQGSDPQVMLRYSRDGGKTWSLQQPWRSMGKIGEYTTRLRWLKMGCGFQFNWELTISDPVMRTIIGAHADVEVGM